MIRFENVTKRYRGTSKPALNDVDFEVQRGEFVFLVGASGSGKSTCLRLILREDIPSDGRVVVLGRDLRTMSNGKIPYFRRQIGAVFQDFRLLPTKTVSQNVAFTLQVIGASRAFIQQAVPEALALVGLEGKGKRMPHELSGGEQQRVAIARALVNRPPVLLADEPTGNLDPATSIDIMQLLARINAGGTTVVMATHEAGFVDQMQRRVIELRDGEMVRDERHGGYGDTSSLPSLAPEPEKGAAAVAALTAVLELHREIVETGQVDPLPPEEIAKIAKSKDAAQAHATADAAVATVAAPKKAMSAEPAERGVKTPAKGAGAKPDTTDAPAEATQDAKTTDAAPDAATVAEAKPAAGPSHTSDSRESTPADKPADKPAAEEPAAEKPAPLTRPNPIIAPDVEVEELGLADRLGLSDEDEDEVGPTR